MGVGDNLGGVGGNVGVVVGLTLVPHISDVARGSIGNVVGDNLGAAIRKNNTVLAVGGIVVAVLVGSEVGARVVIGNSVLEVVHRGGIIGGLMVGRAVSGGLVGGGGGVVGRSGVGSGLVSGGRGMVGGGGVGSRLVGRGRGVIGRGRVGLVGRSGGMVGRGSMDGVDGVDGVGSTRVGRGMDGDVGGGVVGSRVLLLVVVLVDLIGSGRGLAHHLGGVGAVGLVDGGVDGGGIAVLDRLVGGLVGHGHSHEGEEGKESLCVYKSKNVRLKILPLVMKVFRVVCLTFMLDVFGCFAVR